MKAYLKSKKQKLVILSVAAAILVGVGINCSKLNRFDFDIGGVNWNQNDTIEFEHILKDVFYYGSSLLDSLPKQNLVIKNQTEWNTLLNSMDSVSGWGYAQFLSNSVSFSTHQVLAIFNEIPNDGTWGIEIANIVEQACHIIVTYHTWKKTSGNYGRQAFHLIKIPASNKQVVFQEEFDNKVENVPYVACLQSYGDTVFLRGTAYLFIDSLPAGEYTINAMNIIHNTQDSSTDFYASYPLNSQHLCLYSPCYSGVHFHYGSICNFPAFATQWNGKQVYYRGFFRDYEGKNIEFYRKGYLILTHLEEID